MDAHEKAVEIYEKYYYATPSHLADKKQDLLSKRFALICVAEILEAIDEDVLSLSASLSRKYWSNVRQEIINI